jgi:hypothetical protein
MTATFTMQVEPASSACMGVFESHVTVRCTVEQLPRLAQWSRAAGVKMTHIVLARGREQSQPMLTLTGEGPLAAQYATAYRLVGDLRDVGFDPVRVKIEAAPWVDWIPQDDAEAQEQGPARYFEHHVKLLLSPEESLERLADLVSPYGAHVSWNARRTADEGRQERFVTQRCYVCGLPQAAERLTALLTALRGDGREILTIEQEYVVHDSNTAIDDGWITTEVQA